MKLIELASKHKNKILNFALFLLALIIAGNIYKQQVKDIESLKAKIELEIKKNGVLESISKLEKRINSYKKLLAKKDASLIINTITNIARESGIKIVSIRPVSEQRYQEYIKFPFNLTLIASDYHALSKFISKVETYQDLYSVDSIDMRTVAQTKELSVNLRICSISIAN